MPPDPANSAAYHPPGSPEHRFSILIVTSSYLPVMGGSEIEAQRVSEALIARGHRVEIVCPGGPPMPPVSRWTDDSGIPVRAFGGSAPEKIRGHVFALRTALKLLAERRDYDLVYFLMPGLQVALGMLMAKILNKPAIMKFSGSNEIRRLKDSFVGRLQLEFVDRWAGSIMILNEGMTKEAEECGLRSSKLMWMPNPVDVDKYSPPSPPLRLALREKLLIAPDAEVILFLGRLAPEKELPSLIEAFRGIADRRPRAALFIVGDGPDRGSLEKSSADLAAKGRVHFIGAVHSSKVHEWCQASDIFALVSSLEGLPVSLIEAMAVGLPSVVSDIPANRQLIENGVQGLLVPVANADAIRQAIETLLGDARMRADMGSAGRARVIDSFSTGKVTDLYETLFATLLRKRAAS